MLGLHRDPLGRSARGQTCLAIVETWPEVKQWVRRIFELNARWKSSDSSHAKESFYFSLHQQISLNTRPFGLP